VLEILMCPKVILLHSAINLGTFWFHFSFFIYNFFFHTNRWF
jgi:hypothetical protein